MKIEIKNILDILESIYTKSVGDSFWLKNSLKGITRFTFDKLGQLRVSLETLPTLPQANLSIGDSGKPATMVAYSNNNFQSGGRRLIRKS